MYMYFQNIVRRKNMAALEVVIDHKACFDFVATKISSKYQILRLKFASRGDKAESKNGDNKYDPLTS